MFEAGEMKKCRYDQFIFVKTSRISMEYSKRNEYRETLEKNSYFGLQIQVIHVEEAETWQMSIHMNYSYTFEILQMIHSDPENAIHFTSADF